MCLHINVKWRVPGFERAKTNFPSCFQSTHLPFTHSISTQIYLCKQIRCCWMSQVAFTGTLYRAWNIYSELIVNFKVDGWTVFPVSWCQQTAKLNMKLKRIQFIIEMHREEQVLSTIPGVLRGCWSLWHYGILPGTVKHCVFSTDGNIPNYTYFSH